MKKVMFTLTALTVLVINSDAFGQWTGPSGNTLWNNNYTGVGYTFNPGSVAQFMVNSSLSITDGAVADGYTFIKDFTKLQLKFNDWEIPSNNKTYMTFLKTGNIGVGIDNPSYKFHVNGTFNANSIYQNGSPIISSQWTTASGNIYFNTGNVGIGITNPLRTLDLGTSGIVRAQSLELGEGWSRIDWNLYWADGGWKYRNNGWGANLQMNDNDGSIQFVTYASGIAGAVPTGQNYSMTIKPNGNIGIGTTNPQSLLAVNGKITAKEVEVTMNGWSDFVFADNYKLMPLHELEKSIKTNKHLPGIPTEKDVLANGVSLGEMQAKLLQKVEELTLYVIDLKKENDQLKKQMDQLNK